MTLAITTSTILERCQYNFNSGVHTISKTTQDKQNYDCIIAGVELQKYAIDHAMSNQQSEKQSHANTTQSWVAFRTLVATYNFTFFALHSLCKYIPCSLVAVPKL